MDFLMRVEHPQGASSAASDSWKAKPFSSPPPSFTFRYILICSASTRSDLRADAEQQRNCTKPRASPAQNGIPCRLQMRSCNKQESGVRWLMRCKRPLYYFKSLSNKKGVLQRDKDLNPHSHLKSCHEVSPSSSQLERTHYVTKRPHAINHTFLIFAHQEQQ